jgi:hypothetical protein
MSTTDYTTPIIDVLENGLYLPVMLVVVSLVSLFVYFGSISWREGIMSVLVIVVAWEIGKQYMYSYYNAHLPSVVSTQLCGYLGSLDSSASGISKGLLDSIISMLKCSST